MGKKRPHIVLITADELRKDSLGCYGNTVINTPGLDALAAQGIVFERGYTPSPWCLPARCSILTGLFPHNNRAYGNKRERLDPQLPNLYSSLRQSGYTTAHIGKCHFAPVPYGKKQEGATLEGYDLRSYYLGLGLDHLDLLDGKMASVWFADDYSRELDAAGYLDGYRESLWQKEHQKVFPFPGPKEWHPDSWVGWKTVEYINTCNLDSPQFLWASFPGPHYPFDAPKDYYAEVDIEQLQNESRRHKPEEFDDPGKIHYSSYHGPGGIDGSSAAPGGACKNFSAAYWQDLRRNYYANVCQIDHWIGEILSAVQQRFGDNVLIVFTADHGEMLGNHGIWGKNNCAYEDVFNIPFIVRYPTGPQGIRSDAKVMSNDIMATCLKVAGISGVITDGFDIQESMVRGGRDFVLAEGEGFVAISDGRYKYVHLLKGKGTVHSEFYDLEADPDEFTNRIKEPQYDDALRQLQQQLLRLFVYHQLP